MLSVVLMIITVVVSLAAVLALARVLYGPSNADRVAATELLTGLIIALLAIAGWQSWGVHALDVAIGLGLVGFLGSVGLSAACSARERWYFPS